MPERTGILITCEHASAAVPADFSELLAPYIEECQPHRVWDPGARELAGAIAEIVRVPVFFGGFTRLFVDLNRSPTHPEIFSSPIRGLPSVERTQIMMRHYYPFRYAALQALEQILQEKERVVHLSIHTFAPIVDGNRREVDFGLLYSPWRILERELAEVWLYELRNTRPDWKVLPNTPYLGIADGHITNLRKVLPAHRYLGFELEINQKQSLVKEADTLARWIVNGLRTSLQRSRFRQALESARERVS